MNYIDRFYKEKCDLKEADTSSCEVVEKRLLAIIGALIGTMLLLLGMTGNYQHQPLPHLVATTLSAIGGGFISLVTVKCITTFFFCYR